MMLIVLSDDSTMILFPLFLSFISISISVFVSVSLSHSIVSCVYDAKSFMCYSSFSLFSVRLWLLFLLSVDALECVWCNGNRYVDLIQTHHFLYESACFVCVTAKNFPHDAFDDCKTSCALTHTRIFVKRMLFVCSLFQDASALLFISSQWFQKRKTIWV